MKKHAGTLILALLFLISISGCKIQQSSQVGQKSERFGSLIKNPYIRSGAVPGMLHQKLRLNLQAWP